MSIVLVGMLNGAIGFHPNMISGLNVTADQTSSIYCKIYSSDATSDASCSDKFYRSPFKLCPSSSSLSSSSPSDSISPSPSVSPSVSPSASPSDSDSASASASDSPSGLSSESSSSSSLSGSPSELSSRSLVISSPPVMYSSSALMTEAGLRPSSMFPSPSVRFQSTSTKVFRSNFSNAPTPTVNTEIITVTETPKLSITFESSTTNTGTRSISSSASPIVLITPSGATSVRTTRSQTRSRSQTKAHSGSGSSSESGSRSKSPSKSRAGGVGADGVISFSSVETVSGDSSKSSPPIPPEKTSDGNEDTNDNQPTPPQESFNEQLLNNVDSSTSCAVNAEGCSVSMSFVVGQLDSRAQFPVTTTSGELIGLLEIEPNTFPAGTTIRIEETKYTQEDSLYDESGESDQKQLAGCQSTRPAAEPLTPQLDIVATGPDGSRVQPSRSVNLVLIGKRTDNGQSSKTCLASTNSVEKSREWKCEDEKVSSSGSSSGEGGSLYNSSFSHLTSFAVLLKFDGSTDCSRFWWLMTLSFLVTALVIDLTVIVVGHLYLKYRNAQTMRDITNRMDARTKSF
eukprot:TRINITY_DN2702_c0_g1_i4.p1 TRINITY_DN2702_c0_g1~~TRINITY_DN2702_c0_g1_i4.p1  ORF type:complete len:570 (-),score=85.77 TRINITY_DN2702_c0_g1_i4:791-2500(-)